MTRINDHRRPAFGPRPARSRTHRGSVSGRAVVVLALVALACAATMFLIVRGVQRARSGATPGEATPRTVTPADAEAVLDEVITNILQLPVGTHAVEDLGLPDTLVRRIADRVIRASYQDRFHGVVRDPAATTPDPTAAPLTVPPPDAPFVRVVPAPAAPADLSAARGRVTESRPPLRGFRAPMGAGARGFTPFALPENADAELIASEAIVSRRLAADGLRDTLVTVLDAAGAERRRQATPAIIEWLWSIGFPVDLLTHWEMPFVDRSNDAGAAAVVAHVARRLDRGDAIRDVRRELNGAIFAFRPTVEGFAVATESGEFEIESIRAQATRGTYWKGIGAGGALDLIRQLVGAVPEASFLVSAEVEYADSLSVVAATWPLAPGQMSIVAEPLIVAQWAQDNAKVGWVEPAAPGARAVTMAPRYASRRSDGSVFVPGESFLLDALPAAEYPVVQSPLLYQGGNLLPVRDPASGERILLVGEAEIARNTAMGLRRDEVDEAFRVEFGVDRCIVLPSVAFHIDYEITVRAHDRRLVAFVNDMPAAARMILALGVQRLATLGVFDVQTAQLAIAHLDRAEDRAFLDLVAGTVYAQATSTMQFPLSFAELFAVDAIDSPVGNLQRFLAAMDVLVSGVFAEGQMPGNANTRAYMSTIRRTASDRLALHETLRSLGWDVVPVPSFSDGARSINAINGVHDRTRYLMPAYGGLYAPIDAEAAAVFAARLGDGVEIVPVLCGESQRRHGAVHCSVSVYPRR